MRNMRGYYYRKINSDLNIDKYLSDDITSLTDLIDFWIHNGNLADPNRIVLAQNFQIDNYTNITLSKSLSTVKKLTLINCLNTDNANIISANMTVQQFISSKIFSLNRENGKGCTIKYVSDTVISASVSSGYTAILYGA